MMTIGQLVQHLEMLKTESQNYFPDDDSKREGYQFAIEEMLTFTRGEVLSQKID